MSGKNQITLFCSFLLLGSSALFPGQTVSLFAATLEERVAEDIRDSELDDFSRIEAAFILSGVNDEDNLHFYMDWYRGIVNEIRAIPSDPADRQGNASNVFNFLHTRWLKNYQLEATTLCDVVQQKRFNCVSATILFNLICDDLGWETEAFETPTHVYTIFHNFVDETMVENTSSMGFDIMKNLKNYSRYLAQFYPENEVLKIGLDRLYFHEQSRGRRVNNTELLGLLAYNQAYFARKRGNYARAYDLVLLAQDFNHDSRSNIEFELGLYQVWGKQLFDEKKYLDAFAVLADGAYRYPSDSGLRKNTRASFFRAMQDLRQKKDWPKTRQLVKEMLELEILDEKDRDLLGQMLQDWQDLSMRLGKSPDAEDAANLLEKIRVESG